jgi:hypothetical protein
MKQQLIDALVGKLASAGGYRSLRLPADIPTKKRRNRRFPFVVASHITARDFPVNGKAEPKLYYQDGPCAFWTCNNLTCEELKRLIATA